MTAVVQMKSPPRLAIIVPCYNEEETLQATCEKLRTLLAALRAERAVAAQSYICFVDDGSRDKTWEIIARLTAEHDDIAGLKLARNVGHQAAVLAGLHECDGDALITIDADLQDDEGAIREMMQRMGQGYDVVLGVRADRSSDAWSKRFFAESYYRLLKAMGVKTVFNHADYRLLSQRAADALRQFPEANLFLRGMITLIGFKWTTVSYARRERLAGESKYPFRRMLSLAWEGITSFSVVPLRIVSVIGLLVSLASLAVTAWAIYVRLTGDYVPGWASTVVPMYFLGGVQILCLGVIGEYIGKIYMETKQRPRYLVDEHIAAHKLTAPAVRTS
ncbi:MAG: glycosyltransferase family 2 protein [Hyphomicrobiaceae bacterium]|nr:glycosyltransferase family 2 protein [Hyphomicrobiaceae bacterium]